MVKIKQAIVVEGKYAQNALRQLDATAIFPTPGYAGMKAPAHQRQLRQAAASVRAMPAPNKAAARSRA